MKSTRLITIRGVHPKKRNRRGPFSIKIKTGEKPAMFGTVPKKMTSRHSKKELELQLKDF